MREEGVQNYHSRPREEHTFGNTLIFVWSVTIACHVPRKFDPSLEFLLEQIALVEEEDDVDVCEQLLMT